MPETPSHHIPTLLLTVAALLFPALAGAQTADPAAEEGTIHGVVFGPDEGLPLEGVAVSVDGESMAQTNRDGGFEVAAPAGERSVRLQTPRGGVEIEGVRVVAGQTTEVVVEVRADGESDIDIEAPGASTGGGEPAEPEERAAPEAEPGVLQGTVTSLESGEPVEGAQVIVRGASSEAETDANGVFRLELPAGDHDISVIHADFSTGSKEGLKVPAGGEGRASFELTPAAVRLNAYTVTIPKIEGGTIALTEQKKESAAATEVIGAEQFAKSGDSTAAGALKRVTGLTVVGGKYVYVRGLGSRYASTLLNGATLPSPEPEKRVVPLDLFPTSMLESVTIQKTYTPEMPGNFGGGVVRMKTRSYPEEFTFSAGLSLSGDTATTFQRGLTYDGGRLDWLGVSDGTRALPADVAAKTDGVALTKKDRFGTGNFTGEELEEIGEALPNRWNTEQRSVMPNLGGSVEVGDSFDLNGTTAGFLASLSYDFSHDTDEFTETSYVNSDEGTRQENQYDFRETTDNVVASGIVSGGLEFPGGDTIKLTSLLNRVTDDETRRYEGYYSDHDGQIQVSRLRFLERQMMFHQLRGEHTVEEWNDLEVDWQYVYSQARRNEPDRRQYRYDYEDSVGGFALTDRPSSNSRLWSELVDHNHDGGVSASLPFGVWNDLEASAKVGIDAVRKDREVDTRRFKFFSSSGSADVFDEEPEEIFAEENIGEDSIFTLKEITRDSDNYRGTQTLLAGYAMAEVPIVEGLRVNGGARVEYSNQRVETFALFGDAENVGQLQKTDVLPALNVTWAFAEEMQLRGAASRTVNRPSFRELSNSRFSNVVGGREFQGNPDLDRAQITHVDTRWEWYPGRGESVSVGAFAKDFNNPIELTYQSGATPVISPSNVEGATNLGVEIQGRTGLDFLGGAMRDFEVAGNVSLIRSQINIDPDSEKAEILTDTERPLQGQSPYVINAQLGYDNVDRRLNVTLLYNVYGPRISEVGVYGIPNVVEQPFHTLDLTLSKKFESGLKFSAKAKNILNLAHRYTQGGKPTHVEYEGRAFSLGLSYAY